MELNGERLIPAPLETTWAALNDPLVLKSCITGCESLERTGEAAFAAVVAVKIGPVSAKFKGKLQLSDIQPAQSYTLQFDGQGGVAGFGKGSADVRLEAVDARQTKLIYAARAQVGGKLAQIGSRLVDAAAAKLSEDFFQAFEEALKPADGAEGSAGDGGQGGAGAAVVADAARPAAVAAAAPAKPAAGGGRALAWVIGAVIAAAVVYYVLR